jgi:hypothetical protein
MSSSNMSTSNFVPAPLSRTMTITSDPVILSYYAQKAEEFNAQNVEPEPVAVLLSEAEQEEKNKAMKAIFNKLRHTPAVLPRAASISTDPPAPAPLSRTESVRSYEPSTGGLRRTDYDGLTYEPGTTALMPTSGLSRAPSAMPGLFRAPSAMPGLFRAPTTMPTTLSTTEEE